MSARGSGRTWRRTNQARSAPANRIPRAALRRGTAYSESQRILEYSSVLCARRRGRDARDRARCARARSRAAMVRRLHIKVRGLDPPEHQLIRPCTWLKFTLKYHAWFEIRNSKFEIMNRPGDPVLAKFRSLRPAEKALLSLIYILSAVTKCGPKLVFLGPIGWGAAPHWIGP